jgi:hypothetical protein
MLQKESHLRFVCVGREEGVELRDEQIHADTFPWTERPLLIGAVRASDDSAEWIIRRRVVPVILLDVSGGRWRSKRKRRNLHPIRYTEGVAPA